MNEVEERARSIDRIWYLAVYAGVAGMCAFAWLILSLDMGAGTLPARFGLSLAVFWSSIVVVMVIALAATKFTLDYYRQPAHILALDLKNPLADAASPIERARLYVQTAIFIPLGIIDIPAYLLIGYALATGDVPALGVALAYGIVVGRLFKPDTAALLRDTAAELSARLARA